jgi:hypothetical protein
MEPCRRPPLVLALALALATAAADAAPLPRIAVHPGGHYLQTEDGRPFFWLGDTAWQLVNSTTREECNYYLHTRARQAFTVIQTVALPENDSLRRAGPLGVLPFEGADPARPNSAYFDRVVEIVDEAASVGLYVALVPVWGDKLTAPWGDGPRVFTTANLPVARGYGRYIAGRLKDRTNVVWVLGGDRPPRLPGLKNDFLQNLAKEAGFPAEQDWTPIWREIAAGLEEGLGRAPVVLYHPQGGEEGSSVYLHREPWLSINGMQSGHGGGHDLPVWEWIARDWAMAPAKPTMDIEPNYEDHPYNPWPRWDPSTGYFRDHDVRKQTWRSVLAGGCGVTYGHHAVWGFVGPRNDVVNHADRDWVDATHRPGGRQMVYLRRLLESRPYFDRVPDATLIGGDAGEGAQHIVAARDRAGSYAFVYFPTTDQSATIDLARLRGKALRAWWYDPRTGIGTLIGEVPGGAPRRFRTPPYGPDWALVLDDPAAGYGPPGLAPVGR